MAATLRPIQQELVKELANKNALVAEMYQGALAVLAEKHIVNRLALAGHSLREMLEKLADHIDAPIPRKGPTLGNIAENLSGEWNRLLSKSAWPGNPKWNGAIEDKLRKFLGGCETFFATWEKIKPQRRARAAAVIRTSHLGQSAIPGALEEHKANEWLIYSQYFTDIAHHKPTKEEDFLGYLENLEQFLMNTLQPRTFDNRKELQAIIAESENNAN